MSAIRILHLFPWELGINGDVGNVLTLRRRAEWRGHAVEVVETGRGGRLPKAADIVVIGSGPASAQLAVHPDALRFAPTLREWAKDGTAFLGISAGWQLLGRSLTTVDGTVLDGIGILPSSARLVTGRANGEFTGVRPDGSLLAGYENHSAVTELHEGEPLCTVGHGHGNTGLQSMAGERHEGVSFGPHLGVAVHGPFLPMNPSFADDLLRHALGRRGDELSEPEERVRWVDLTAERAREAIRGRVGMSGAGL